MRQTTGEKIFIFINNCFLALIGFIALYPLIYVAAASMSSTDAILTGKVLLLPIEINFSSYKEVLSEQSIWIGYGNAIYYTAVGTAVNLFITVCGAYPLSKKRLPGRKYITFFVVLTLWFQAGIIPFYLNLKEMGLLNLRITIIIAFACSTFNMILMRTYFQSSVPASLEEAAKVDGASDLYVLGKIYLPLSKPVLATIGLFYAVNRWNGYFWPMIIIRDNSKMPLQVILKKMIVEMRIEETITDMDMFTDFSVESLIYATIIISIVPMMIAYPYIQKFFTKGMMIGAIKG